ncbi:MAG TPA: succinate dehydrogenase cytochrome b subunit [Verrucomicrobiae bacterium]|nr:succinate dehydrogenase cytochrome b subunit [Verrucomicrobiae bacterium]
MNLFERIWRSSLGKKYVMAITGAALFLFTVGHLIGNLQVFGPPELINTYAHFLKSKPSLLWGARLGLLACVTLHILAAVSLTAAGRSARPVGYDRGTTYGSTVRSRYMLVSGLVILAFVVYHLAHFTALLPGINGTGDFRRLTTDLHGEKVADVYAMMLLGFQVWWVVLLYLVAQGLLFMHLGHGLSAMFQSVGFRNHVWWPRIELFAKAASIALFVGYASIPLAIYLRVVGHDYAERARQQFSSSGRPVAGAGLVAAQAPSAGAKDLRGQRDLTDGKEEK